MWESCVVCHFSFSLIGFEKRKMRIDPREMEFGGRDWRSEELFKSNGLYTGAKNINLLDKREGSVWCNNKKF